MSGEVGAGFTLLLGVIALRMGLTDAHLRYVKAGMQPWLVIAGVVLVLLGATALLRTLRQPDDEVADDAHGGEPGDGHGHGGQHPHGPRVAWLLALPVLAVFLVYPGPLGAYAADRGSSAPPPPTRSASYSFPPLPPPTEGAVDVKLVDFVQRALYDDRRSLEGRPVRMTGFVTPGPDPQGFLLTRFVLSCCAADGRPVQVAATGLPEAAPPADTWVEVLGTWEPAPGADAPKLRVSEMEVVPEPPDPYES